MTQHRLVTVAGRAGVGKSRLAAAIASTTAGRQRLVTVRWQGNGPAAPGSLTSLVARTLTGSTPPEPRTADLRGRVAEHLAGAATLLFLDDIDPAHAECLGLVQRLLMAVPTLRVLVTSRRALGLGDERVLRLEPLSVEADIIDDIDDIDDVAAGLGSPTASDVLAPAVRLFLDRARAAVRADGSDRGTDSAAMDITDVDNTAKDIATKDMTVKDMTVKDIATVAEICRLLEGVPLAIVLAAEQTVRHPVGELAELIRRQHGWLTGDRPALRRHRSVRDAIGATYVLCERAVRIVWARASVFAATFTEQNAVFLCADGDVPPHRVPGHLAELVAYGVLEAVGDPGGLHMPRYRMPRAAREFGAERLGEAGEFDRVAERRLVHCRRLAAVAESLWDGGQQNQAVRLLRDEQDDLTAMLRYAATRPGHAEDALQAVLGVWFWWAVHDRAEEGRHHLNELLPLCEADGPAAARGRWLAAWLTAYDEPRTATELLQKAWPAAVLAGDSATVGRIAHVEGVLALHRRDLAAAAAHFRQAAESIPAHAHGGPSAAVSHASAAVTQAAFAPTEARRSARRALTHPGIRDDAWAQTVARYAAAFVDHRLDRRDRALRRARRTLARMDARLAAPHGRAALHQLITDIEAGTPSRLYLPGTHPATDAPAATTTADRALR
ncbi:ATP-binding protein [Streptomyces sp. NPDC002851]